MRRQEPPDRDRDNADRIPEVAADLAEAAFWNAGQNCTAGSRILVHSSIKDEFVAALVKAANQRRVAETGRPGDRDRPTHRSLRPHPCFSLPISSMSCCFLDAARASRAAYRGRGALKW
ncbi:aldehyde dehydrogenase family protein [Streptomyces sp. LZ34]